MGLCAISTVEENQDQDDLRFSAPLSLSRGPARAALIWAYLCWSGPEKATADMKNDEMLALGRIQTLLRGGRDCMLREGRRSFLGRRF